MSTPKKLNRRTFIAQTSVAGLGLSIVPSRVLGGSGRIAPSDKINVALIGSGTQAIKMLPDWLKREELQFVSVCDPNRESYDYPQWGKSEGEKKGAPGGREVGRKMINDFYSKKSGNKVSDGCTTYADFREQQEKEKGLDAVFIMTPDHLHATIALAAMKRKLNVATHKPIGNFMKETRLACESAKQTGVATHCFAFQDHKELYTLKAWIDSGLIGKVKALHRWTNRPMWPQGSPYLPEGRPIPEGFDWQLWLGPSTDRPYSPDYTHTVFRGWYEFGAGCLADMGYYGFWKDWRLLNLGMPVTAEGAASFTCEIKDFRSTWVKNNVSYPHAATMMWEVPVNGKQEMMDVFWYEGGIKPPTPRSLIKKGQKMPQDGTMFIGERGTILTDYGYGNPLLLDSKEGDNATQSIKVPPVKLMDQDTEMITAFKGGNPSRGSFENAQTIAEAICLGNLAIRMDDRLEWDNGSMKVVNMPEANEFVSRKYRQGWEL
ncbi:MAG TPA: Gfo/Idh/MocA family oxidoreductase [Prolixibacteraceae bacterium]|nr:Gfo/Idh/MocA family oxidoreductase [Prolixibacteraceae bacterium]